jgi:hypothetical protein
MSRQADANCLLILGRKEPLLQNDISFLKYGFLYSVLVPETSVQICSVFYFQIGLRSVFIIIHLNVFSASS